MTATVAGPWNLFCERRRMGKEGYGMLDADKVSLTLSLPPFPPVQAPRMCPPASTHRATPSPLPPLHAFPPRLRILPCETCKTRTQP